MINIFANLQVVSFCLTCCLCVFICMRKSLSTLEEENLKKFTRFLANIYDFFFVFAKLNLIKIL